MADQDATPSGTKRNVSIWVKVFVLLHIIAITSWSLPYAPSQYLGNPPKTTLRVRTDNPVAFFTTSAEYLRNEFLIGNQLYVKDSPLKFYLLSSGFWQYWDMFAPNPASIDVYGDAIITYMDGTKRRYAYPRIYSMPIPEKFMKERWRKFYERAGSSDFDYLWPIFAQHVAEMNFDNPKNPPIRVELHRHELEIKPPGVRQPTEYTDEVYFTWHVNRDALLEDKEH